MLVDAPAGGCPKHMVYGPCGGVDAAGGCEVDRRPCPFVSAPTEAWRGAPPSHRSHLLNAAAHELTALRLRRPLVVAEVPSTSLNPSRQREVAGALAGGCDAGITGDAPWARLQLPPVLRAQLLADEGLRAWTGLNCRDRNRVALEGELLGLAAVGAAAVHCVTGDHPCGGDRPDAAPVFDLDSTRLAAAASGSGMLVSVAESPASPPTGGRPARLAEKAQAGAGWCVISYTADRSQLEDFLASVRERVAGLHLIVSIPVVTDAAGLRLLARYPSLSLPPATTAALEGPNPHTAALGAALAMAEAALSIDGVSGVNLAAPAVPDASASLAADVSADVAAVGRALGGGR